jgi:hypothetical protein
MPLKTNIGVNRKIADNNYGSRGASVNLEIELDSSLIQEPERLQERIRQVFRLAQQSLDEELARQQPTNGTASLVTGNSADGPAVEPPRANSNGHRNGNGHSASEKQLTYARQLAGQIRGLGVRKLEMLAQKMFSKPLAGLTSMDASGLIDTLKSIKDGTISLDAALEGSTS